DGPTVTDSKASAATRKAMLEAWGNSTPAKPNRSSKLLRQAIPILVILIALAGGLLLLSNNSNKVINDAATKTGPVASATDGSTKVAVASTSEATATTSVASATPKTAATESMTVANTDVPTV